MTQTAGNFLMIARSNPRMIANRIAVLIFMILLAAGCTDQEATARRAKEEADAKARAEAARKEMDAMPKAFKSRDYFKKNEPDKKPDPAPEKPKANP
jgi:hypothetical protein